MTDKKKCKIDYKKLQKITKNLSKNYWAISTIVLAVLFIATLVLLSSGMCGATISADEAGQKVVDFLLNNQGVSAEIVEINDNGQLYEVVLSANGQQGPLYITKDGKSLVPQSIPLTANAVQNTARQTAPASTFSEEDNIKIQEFSSCLVEKGFRIYGAGWCGHCQTVVKTFGGIQNMEGVFIECSDTNRQPTEYAQLCSDQQIQGFPTMKLNDEVLQISRTFEAIAEATGCSAPEF